MSTAILSILILVVVAGLMFFDKIPMTTIAILGALVCCALGMYEFSDIFSELGGTTIVLMFGLSIIGAAMYRSGLANLLAAGILRLTGKSEPGVILGILLVSAILSAVSSNTAVVLMMIPLVKGLSKEANISLKRTMYPLAIGAGAGGACTLIGATSNVAGNAVLGTAGLPLMGFWDLGWIGIPFTIVSFIFMLTLGMKLLPKAEGYDGDPSEDFSVKVNTSKPKMILTAVIVVLSIVAMMISSSALFVASLVGAVLLMLTGCITEQAAFGAIEWKMFLLIVGFGVISSSISNSGGGDLIANGFVSLVGTNASPILVCAVLFLLTSLITHFMSNVVTIMLMGPIAIHIAEGLGVNPVAMVITAIVACNACYATPLGSPYFTILMPVAGYKFKDYVRMGLPFVLINFIIAVVIVPLVWKF